MRCRTEEPLAIRVLLWLALLQLPGGCSSGTGAQDAAAGGDLAHGRIQDGSPLPRDAAIVDDALPGPTPDMQAAVDVIVCPQLATDYAQLLDPVKDCNPYTALNECTTEIPDRLGCPCSTYANSGMLGELKQMYAISQQWQAQGCQAQDCPPDPCPRILAGACTLTGSGATAAGRCTDVVAR